MLLLALAIAPGLAICLFIYLKDKYDKEPLLNLAVSFALGMLSTIPAVIIQLLAGNILQDPNRQSVLSYAWFAYGIVAISEEGSKFMMLRLYAYPKKAFNEPFDGIVYAVMVGMGFATLENIGYVYQFGISTGVLRFFLSVPAHASFAILMGYYVGLAKFNAVNRASLLWRGVLVAVLFHGTFDFFLFLQKNDNVTQYVSASLLSLGALFSFYIAIRLSLRALRLQQALSKQQFEQRNNISN
jgi:RsiW-degrading membrane proteinase PrsW (M82 family)